MRIEKVTFKNLNSLAGTWSIDFTNERYREDGIFAITGPTGAGKSTVLDAICLALYGQTPRLATISKSTNEIMTRQTGDCFAEVVFSTGKGCYRSHWSQRRARNKPEGALQPAKQELVNLNTNEMVNLKKGIADKINELTGLDFKRFTRSMLLAQGDFAAFLKASSDDRAVILEKITGMEIYSEISEKVYRRMDEESKALKVLESQLGGIEVLADDARKEKENQRDVLTQKETELKQSQNAIQEALTWKKTVKGLEETAQALAEKDKALQNENDAFKSEAQKLQVALQAQKVDPSYEALKTIRETLNQTTQLRDKAARDKPVAEEALKAAQAASDSSKTRWDVAENARQSAMPIISDVRLRDAAIKKQSIELEELKKEVGSLQESINQRQKELLDKEGVLLGLKEETALLEQYLKNHAGEKVLVSAYSGLEASSDHLKEIEDEIKCLQKDDQKSKNREKELRAQLEKETQDLDALRSTAERLKNQQETVAQELKGVLQGETEQSLDTQLEALKEKRHYRQLVQSLEEHRRGLQDGAPCPLCGATHHPYAEGNIPAVDEIQTQIDAVQKTLNEAIRLKNQLQELVTKATLQKETIMGAETNLRLVQERLDGVIEQRREALNLLDEKKEKFALDSNAFYESVSGFDLALPMSPTEVINELLAKKTLWVKNEEAFNEKQKDLERVASEIREIKSLKAEKEKTWQGKHSQFVQGEEKLNEEKRIRTELFGDKDPDQVEKSLNDTVTQTKSSYEQMRKAADEKADQLRTLISAIETYDRQIKETQGRELQALSLFEASLKKFGFDEQEHYFQSHLESSELESLQDKSQSLTERINRLQGEMEQNNQTLAQEKAKNLTDKTIEELEAEQKANEIEQTDVRETLGNILYELRGDDEAREKSKDYLRTIAAKQLIVDQWSALSGLIGSADGRKFRNYAQGITFDIMIAYANQALMKMNDRYLLIRKDKDGLELEVQDNYQAGVIRSTKNLSGGESFIVSLALALGLSKMASQNVQVESLFLDEGFGTLDEDALENALKTLSGLHQQGKLIGVISHVQELKDRISTQIIVTPKALGRSVLSGPGVEHLVR